MGDDSAELVAVDARKVAVEEDHVVGVEIDLRNGLVAVVGDVDGHPLVAQAFGDPVGMAGHVLDHEDPHPLAPVLWGTAAGRTIWTRSPPSARA